MSFTISTDKATWKCTKSEENWTISFERKERQGSQLSPVTGIIDAPASWARTMVFQFIDNLDKNMLV